MEHDFEEIYSKYYQSIYRYLLTITKNSYISEEIAQETFYKALKNIKKYNPKYNILTWLCSIAKNTYYTMYKKEKVIEDIDDDIKDTEKDIISKIIDSETNEELLKIVHSLEEPYKEVLTLRVYGELSFKQIANIFNKTESWARVTFYRSKGKIKEILNEKEL
ncbi:MAG: RNA polymerase sigma factor [Bacilli bacterium]|nr:RNA polymerase sigma factor [Bacilli bacterium]